MKASELAPGNVYVDGPFSASQPLSGGYRVTVYSNFPGAVEMRIGNTAGERDGSSWKPYEAQFVWRVPSGTPAVDAVYIAVRDAAGQVISSAPKIRTPWCIYAFLGPIADHIMYPATVEGRGGPADQPYVWGDGSRWEIDTPETPDSVLAFITYSRWYDQELVNLAGLPMQFYLRGQDLDLKGGLIYFWALGVAIDPVVPGTDCRMHKVDQPLAIGTGQWGSLQTVTPGSLAGWDYPPSHGDGALDLTRVKSWGLSIRGFSDKPTGRLDMCWLD